MIKRITITVLMVAMIALVGMVATAQIDEDNAKTVQPVYSRGYNSVSVSTETASTTAKILTALSNRRAVEFRVNESSKYLHVALGSTTVSVNAANAIIVDSTNPFRVELDSSVPISYIASEAFGLSIIQIAK